MLLFLIFAVAVQATSMLKATSLVTCMENSQLVASYFEVMFYPDDGSVHYDIAGVSEIDEYANADISVYAYGFKIIEENISLCSLGLKQFCPLFPGDIEVSSVQYVDSDLINRIPGIAYQVPDIDALVRVIVKDLNGTQLACIQAEFTNGKTVNNLGVKWATAVIAGLGLLVSALMSTMGNSVTAAHIAANAASLFLYFQSVVVVGMESVHRVPPIASSWCANLAWSMGLIRVGFMQDIIRWYIQATGGTPTQYFKDRSVSVLVQRGLDGLTEASVQARNLVRFLANSGQRLLRRDSLNLDDNDSLLVFRGIKRIGVQQGIEISNIVPTGFVFFVLAVLVIAAAISVFRGALGLAARFGWLQPARFATFRANWRRVLKGSLLRVVFIGVTQLTILSLYEFTQRNSPALVVLAVLFLVLPLGVIAWAAYRSFTYARQSVEIHKNPAYILYSDSRVLDKYGFFYTQFLAQKYFFGAILVGYIFVKSCFIGLAQDSGKTQGLALFVIEASYLGCVIRFRPFLDGRTNILNIIISVVMTVNAFLFLFFSDLFGQPQPVNAIMGWIFFILNAAFSLILLILLIVYCCLAVLSKNPDARFVPPRDDRVSFQPGAEAKQAAHDELAALGTTAQDHKGGWTEEMYNSSSSSLGSGAAALGAEKESFGARVARKLSLRRKQKGATRLDDDYEMEAHQTAAIDESGEFAADPSSERSSDLTDDAADGAKRASAATRIILSYQNRGELNGMPYGTDSMEYVPPTAGELQQHVRTDSEELLRPK